MSEQPTVTVELIEGYAAIRFTWSKNPIDVEVTEAFFQITRYLNHANTLLDVVVDITSGPHFPLQATISGLLSGPLKHPRMGRWLVVGSNRMARMIAQTTMSLGRRSNIVWFNTYEEALSVAKPLNAEASAQAVNTGQLVR